MSVTTEKPAVATAVRPFRVEVPDEELVPHQATFARLTIRRRRGLAVLRLRQAM
jgi:hypothetical protein